MYNSLHFQDLNLTHWPASLYAIFILTDSLFQHSALSAAVYLGPLIYNLHYLQEF